MKGIPMNAIDGWTVLIMCLYNGFTILSSTVMPHSSVRKGNEYLYPRIKKFILDFIYSTCNLINMKKKLLEKNKNDTDVLTGS